MSINSFPGHSSPCNSDGPSAETPHFISLPILSDKPVYFWSYGSCTGLSISTYVSIKGFPGHSSPCNSDGPSDCITSTGVSRTLDNARIYIIIIK